MSAPITLDGRAGKDPEIKISQTGKAITRLSLVTNGRKKVGDEWQDVDTTWWDITFFGNTAEAAAEQIHKGARVIVTGRVRDEKWTAPDGTEKSRKAVIGDTFGVRHRLDGNVATTSSSSAPTDDPWASEAPF